MSADNFDARAERFGKTLALAANWKHNFQGAAYSTRIAAAIKVAEQAIEEGRQLLADDCSHPGWNFKDHGRTCFACGKIVMDFGD